MALLISTYSQLYWLTRLNYVQGFLIGMACLLGLVIAITYIVSSVEEEPAGFRQTRAKTIFVWSLFIGLILSSCLIPDKNEVIFIVAGGKTIDWAKQDTSINKIPSQTTAIISEFLDKQIKEMNKK